MYIMRILGPGALVWILALVCAACDTARQEGDDDTVEQGEPCLVPEGEYTFDAVFTDDFLTNQGECSWVNSVSAPTPSDGFTMTIAVPANTSCGVITDSVEITASLPFMYTDACPANSQGVVSCIYESRTRVDGSDIDIEGTGELYWEYNSGQSGGSCSPRFLFGGPI